MAAFIAVVIAFGLCCPAMYEHRSKPLLSRRKYLRRVAKHALLAAALVAGALALGAVGFAAFENTGLVDSIYDAAMFLTGMGLGTELRNPGAKIFASFYSLLSVLIVLTSMSILVAPAIHRMLHTMHLEPPGRKSAAE
ncbi:MAG TPA: hypothetical protein VG797_00250 [Phycisphaerales bacterium]|nr:hypothetical protein [Phycisphaerales bacterium]